MLYSSGLLPNLDGRAEYYILKQVRTTEEYLNLKTSLLTINIRDHGSRKVAMVNYREEGSDQKHRDNSDLFALERWR